MLRNFKYVVGLVFVFVLILSVSVGYANEEQQITVLLDSNPIKFDVAPTIIDGVTLVPLRAIFEALDINVGWDEATQTVMCTKDSTIIVLQIDNENAFINGEKHLLDVPAKLINSRTLVPIGFIETATGANVNWDEQTNTVIISTAE